MTSAGGQHTLLLARDRAWWDCISFKLIIYPQ